MAAHTSHAPMLGSGGTSYRHQRCHRDMFVPQNLNHFVYYFMIHRGSCLRVYDCTEFATHSQIPVHPSRLDRELDI